MPLAAWRDFLPSDREQSELATKEAIAAARASSAALLRCPVGAMALNLYAATAEAMRAEVILDALAARGVAKECGPVFAAAREGIDPSFGPDAVAGVLAFAALGGGPMPYEAKWLVPFVEAAYPSRPLAYAALSTTEPALARMLSDDPRVHELAAALETRSVEPFFAAVESFPSAKDLGYAELAMLARGFVAAMNPGWRTGQWVRAVVFEGREAALGPPPAPPPKTPDRAPCAFAERKLQTDEQGRRWKAIAGEAAPIPATTFTKIALADVHPRHGGRELSIDARGAIDVVAVTHLMEARHYQAHLTAAGLVELVELLRANDLTAMRFADREGLTGEARPILTLERSGAATTVAKWAADEGRAFDALVEWLHDAGFAASYVTRPVARGRWVSGRFVAL